MLVMQQDTQAEHDFQFPTIGPVLLIYIRDKFLKIKQFVANKKEGNLSRDRMALNHC